MAGAPDAAAPTGLQNALQDTLRWERESSPRLDADKQDLFATVPPGVFDLPAEGGAELLGEWWSLRDADGRAVGYGWLDEGWGGDVEVLVAVHGGARQRGLGSYLLDLIEREAAGRGVNYVYNTVRQTHPERERLHDWLAVRGYRGSDRDEALRKRVSTDQVAVSGREHRAAPPGRPISSDPVSSEPVSLDARSSNQVSSDRGPGHEEAGGYVDVDDHRF